MPRNDLAGTHFGKSKSAVHYQRNAKSREKKKRYDTEFNKAPKQRKKRAMLVRENRKRGTNGNHDNKDLAHYKNKDGKLLVKQQSASINRGDKKNVYFRVVKKNK